MSSSPAPLASTPSEATDLIPGFAGQKLTLGQFTQIAGKLAGYPFVKIVLDRHEGKIHFINNNRYPFHADYVGEQILGKKPGEIDAEIDAFNQTVYFDENRRFFFGILSLQKTVESGPDTQFFTLETVEVDTMDRPMVEYFYGFVKDWVDPLAPLLPARVERNLRSGLFHGLVSVGGSRFQEQWAAKALGSVRESTASI